MNRIFWNGNESHSRNLGVTREGGYIHHDSPSPSLPSQEQRAYASYAKYSRAIGAPVLDFSSWYRKDSGIGGTLFANYLQFHGMTVKDVGRQDWTAIKRLARKEAVYDGSWDNAVRAMEGQ